MAVVIGKQSMMRVTDTNCCLDSYFCDSPNISWIPSSSIHDRYSSMSSSVIYFQRFRWYHNCYAAVCYMMAWTPYAVVGLWSTYGNPQKIPESVMAIAGVMAKLAPTTNPLVYVAFSKNHRWVEHKYRLS